MKWLTLTVIFLACAQSEAAFRVYQLKVSYYDPQIKKNVTKSVQSSLDHLQYEHYHSGYGRMQVTLVDTWYCPGDTARKRYCKKPIEKKIPRDIASAYDKEKRTPLLPLNRQPIIP